MLGKLLVVSNLMKLSLRIDPSKIPEFDDPMDNANIISEEG